MLANPSALTLLTDMYQLTMAYGYWKLGKAQQEATFYLYFRRSPFQSGYTIAAGLEDVLQLLESWSFSDSDIQYIRGLTGNDGKPLFEEAFLSYLAELKFQCDVEAVPEGTVVFPNQPMLRVTGPMLQCQLVETPLLNIINFQTLIATKAARICQAAAGDPVLEFGLRRAQGPDGGVSASRAAYIGGCAATSNLLAGKTLGIPVKGTHAHSWVMSFDNELESFSAYAQAMPNNCIFLVDTYDTIEGVANAIEIGNQLKAAGHRMVGIRLDSGDLAYLSVVGRKMLDEAGFADAVIVASNDLDEYTISSLKQQGAKIGVWGVGTRLATAHDQPALGGVYKLSALKDESGQWQPKIKLSEQAIKVSCPGRLNVRRFFRAGKAAADAILDENTGDDVRVIVDPLDPTRKMKLQSDLQSTQLLEPVFKSGNRCQEPKSLTEIRQRTKQQLDLFHDGIKRFSNPHQYPVGLEERLYELKTNMIFEARGQS